jgi:hypothetical protein
MRIIAVLLIALLPSVALSRAAPRYNVHETCVGMLEHSQYSNPGWYSIDICLLAPAPLLTEYLPSVMKANTVPCKPSGIPSRIFTSTALLECTNRSFRAAG